MSAVYETLRGAAQLQQLPVAFARDWELLRRQGMTAWLQASPALAPPTQLTWSLAKPAGAPACVLPALAHLLSAMILAQRGEHAP